MLVRHWEGSAMMYSNKLVCSVKVGRKILREKVENGESTVFIPFGSEYSLLLKNLGGRNAVVNIEIDGRKVSERGFYIKAGQTADIERFVESLVEGRRFRFIEKTEEISDFRGDKVDDGIIRVTWQFEKPLPEVKEIHYNYKHEHDHYHIHSPWCRCSWCHPPIWYGPITFSNTSAPIGSVTHTTGSGGTQSSCFFSARVGDAMNAVMNGPDTFRYAEPEKLLKNSLANDAGITVEGSKSFQSFGTAYASELEPNVHSMVIKLSGRTAVIGAGPGPKVTKLYTVKRKRQCPSCGRKWKKSEYCGNCGTALID